MGYEENKVDGTQLYTFEIHGTGKCGLFLGKRTRRTRAGYLCATY